MKLYKYTTINEYTRKNLKNNQIYCQSPNEFNDPYEFIYKYDDNVDDKEFFDLIDVFYSKEDAEHIKKNKTKKEVLTDMRDYYYPQYCN